MNKIILFFFNFWVFLSIGPHQPNAWAHGALGASTGGLGQLTIIIMTTVILFSLFLVFTHQKKGWTVLVTGGGGYVGSILVPKLLQGKHRVTVLDLYSHGENMLQNVEKYATLKQLRGSITNINAIKDAVNGCDAVIHLACPPSLLSENSDSTKTNIYNTDDFRSLVQAAKAAGVKRFINTSSFHVYGNSKETEVDENESPDPQTQFSKYKLQCEKILEEERELGFIACTVRPAHIYGDTPTQRLGHLVCMLHEAIKTGSVVIDDPHQKFSNIHVNDIADLYLLILNQTPRKIDGKIFNASSATISFSELIEIIQTLIGQKVNIIFEPAQGTKSVQISSKKIYQELGFRPKFNIEKALLNIAKTTQKTAL